ncbi:MAG: C10 family peptidase [Muribaculaceae bacterium]|nr:C10 family peptidase [Muribaculaceae bacterium]
MISFSQPISATKIIAALTCAMMCPLTISARLRTVDEAQKVAEKYIRSSQPDSNLTPVASTTTRGESDNYFVFNVGTDNGYIIVAADDRFQEVLGYSERGTYSTAISNPSFGFWINALSEEMGNTAAESAENIQDPKKAPITRAVNAVDVAPMLKTKWGQNAPYNNECWETGSLRPTIGWVPGHAPTGCVATAMAQVMKYHEWPQSYGEGADTYEYKWDIMADSYDGSESEEAIDQVAKLMKHIGTSVNMKYQASASSASSFAISGALVGKFGYDDATIQKIWRNSFGYEELHNILYKEMAEGRPVIVGGEYPDGGIGHEFVLDGCTSDGFFHINWGWDGYCDGYFRLTSLRPADYGTGGSQQGYSFEVDFTVGIQPKRNTDTHELRAVITPFGDLRAAYAGEDGMLMLDKRDDIVLGTENGPYHGFMNTGTETFNGGYIGCANRFVLRIDNLSTGELVDYLESNIYSPSLSGWKSGVYFSAIEVLNPYELLEEGNGPYKLTLYYRLEEEGQLYPVIFGPGRRSSLTLERVGDQLKISHPKVESAVLASLPADFTRLQRRDPQTMDLALSNPGNEEYLGEVKCRFTDSNGNVCSSLTDYVMVNLLPGQNDNETLTVYNVTSVQPGIYTLGLYDYRDRLISEPREIEIYDYKLTVNEAKFPDPVFRQILLTNFDTNSDGALADEELARIQSLELNNIQINDFKGIEQLYALSRLTLTELPTTSLDLSGCQSLYWLDIKNTPLESLTLAGADELSYINVENSQLTSLDLSSLSKLSYLYLNDNLLSSLDLPKEDKLRTLMCRNNKLTKIDLSPYSEISRLALSENSLTSLEITHLKKLEYLECYSNQVETLDLRGLDNLTQVYASNMGLRNLFISSHPVLTELYAYNNNLEGSLDLSNCPAIQRIDLDDNNLTELVLGQPQDLKVLYLSRNSLSGKLDLSATDQLVTLDLYTNAVTELLLGDIANLQQLGISSNKIGGTLDLSNASKLEKLYASNNEIEGIVFGSHPLLKTIQIQNNKIGGTLDISGMPIIEEIRASYNNISDFKYADHPELGRLLLDFNALTHFQIDDFPNIWRWSCIRQEAYLSIATPNLNTKAIPGFEIARASDWWACWYEGDEYKSVQCDVISGVIMIPEEAGRDVELVYSYLTDAANNEKTNFTIHLTREGFNSIDDVLADGSVSIDGNCVTFAEGVSGEIYATAGVRVFSGSGECSFLPKGIYILRIGSSVTKISIP